MKHKVAATLMCLATLTPTLLAGDWPGWRGPNRDDISTETGLLKAWPEAGPKKVWTFDNAGKGYSGVAVVEGRLFTLGTRDETEQLMALDAKTGKELWSLKVDPGLLKNRWGDGPRGTPTVDGGMVYAISGKGNLVCANAADGKLVWQQSLTDLGGSVPGWGYTESPLVDGGKVVCTPGGPKGSMAAFDKKTGKLLWQSAELTDGAQYASIIAADLNGGRQYIQLTMATLFGVNADNGKVLWKSAWPGRTAVIPTPIHKDGQVYVTSGYGVGSKLVKVDSANNATDVYENKVMKNHHGGVVLVGGHLYGYSDGSGWMCQDFKTGEEVWSERTALGKGAVAYADGMLYCLAEDSGTLVLVEASPSGWKEKSRFKLDPQSSIRSPAGRIWTHPVISNGHLYLRDQDLIHCYAIKAG